jgi:CheY-like chemotaxis protein
MASDMATLTFSGRVLVVDDMTDGRIILSKILKRSGLEVDTAGDGSEGCEKALAASQMGRPFDLVLMDMHMPVMDGFTGTALLRSNRYTGKIVALTGMGDAYEQCINAGCDEFAAKPIEVATLMGLLRRFIPHVTTKSPQFATGHNQALASTTMLK